MLLSICIPNYKREECLNNCLNSIYISKKNFNLPFEVCISDNNSGIKTERIISFYKKKLPINFKKNQKNIGMGPNIIKTILMSKGKFTWVIGNDDLIFPFTLKKIYKILNSNKDKDFFFINSCNLDSRYVFSYKQPFNTSLIPSNLETLSKLQSNKSINFIDLINPHVSFDYLMGIFLSLFNTKKFKENIHILDNRNLNRKGTFSTFENTAPHVSVFAKAFIKSKAYFVGEPLSVNIFGKREWSHMWSFIEIVRIPEALEEYRKNGLPFYKYYIYKNYSLKNFIPCLIKIIFSKPKIYYKNTSIIFLVLKNFFYPNVYFSLIYFLKRKTKDFINNNYK
jgi:hypothetical protein